MTSSLKIILFIMLFFSIGFSTSVFSQNKYKRKISISEWVAEMEDCKNEYYGFRDTEIYYDYPKDSLYAWNLPRNIKPTDLDKKKEISIFPNIVFINCKLPDNSTCQLRNIVFQGSFIFNNCEGAEQFIFYNCTFKQGFDFLHSGFKNIEFSFCSILQRAVVNDMKMSRLEFNDCTFFTDSEIVKSPYHYGFEKENQTYQYLFRFTQAEKIIHNLSFSHCKVLPTDVKPIIYLRGGKYDVISFKGIDFSNSIIHFSDCSVKENLSVEDCKINQPLGVNRFNFPQNNTSFNWRLLDSVGLGIYRDYALPPVTNNTDTLSSDIHFFNELNSSYRKFFSMYRTRGDIESANACYKQMKDMETGRYRRLYQHNPSINKWFNWRFNQFLKYFSEYGTNPVQSLIISMWVILAFAGVYFFFYSDWDGINRTFLIKQHRKTMEYFRSEQKLEDFYTDNYMEDFKTFDDYKKEMAESKIELPVFIILLGKPLYLLSIIRHKVFSFIYRRTEILQGRWVDLKPARKVFVGFIVSFSIIIYLIYLGIIRAINSITLSINAFSTLGFGAIPVKGTSRYVTILEGFLGWFLLSIFSVSLISQMLQN